MYLQSVYKVFRLYLQSFLTKCYQDDHRVYHIDIFATLSIAQNYVLIAVHLHIYKGITAWNKLQLRSKLHHAKLTSRILKICLSYYSRFTMR